MKPFPWPSPPLQFILGNTGFAHEGISHQPNSAELLAAGITRSALSLQNLQSLLHGNSSEGGGRRGTHLSGTPGDAFPCGSRSSSSAAEEAAADGGILGQPDERTSPRASGMLRAEEGVRAAAIAAAVRAAELRASR